MSHQYNILLEHLKTETFEGGVVFFGGGGVTL